MRAVVEAKVSGAGAARQVRLVDEAGGVVAKMVGEVNTAGITPGWYTLELLPATRPAAKPVGGKARKVKL